MSLWNTFSAPPIQWIMFPGEWRANSKLQKRMLFYTLFLVVSAAMHLIYQAILGKIRGANIESQHFIALALPAAREAYIWIASKLFNKCHCFY